MLNEEILRCQWRKSKLAMFRKESEHNKTTIEREVTFEASKTRLWSMSKLRKMERRRL